MVEVCEVEVNRERECEVTGCEQTSEFRIVLGGGPSERRLATHSMFVCGAHGFELYSSFGRVMQEWFERECRKMKEGKR